MPLHRMLEALPWTAWRSDANRSSGTVDAETGAQASLHHLQGVDRGAIKGVSGSSIGHYERQGMPAETDGHGARQRARRFGEYRDARLILLGTPLGVARRFFSSVG